MRARSIAAALFFIGCGAASQSPAPPRDGVHDAPHAEATAAVIADARPSIPPPVLLPEGTLDERIERASKAMRDTQFQDVSVIIELARLQLVRDNKVADSDGANDLLRGKKNSQRAVAVDDKNPQARLLLALAVAQSFRKLPGSDESQIRGARLKLVELSAASIPKSEGALEAARKTLVGFVALENGDRATAKALFESATRETPELAAAWAGLGDALRSAKDYPRALDANRQAAGFQADDKGIEASIEAAEKGIVLALPKAASGAAAVDRGGPLAPSDKMSTPTCSAAVAATSVSQDLCAGLAGLARARAPQALDAAAVSVVSGFQSLRSFCDQKDPVCGDFVAPALLAAGHGFRSASLPAKSITAFKLLVMNRGLPGGKELALIAMLEIADQYFSIGVFDEAASWYELYARERGPGFEKARDRAAFIRSAFQDAGGPDAPPGTSSCQSPLVCGVRYLLADRRWATPPAKP